MIFVWRIGLAIKWYGTKWERREPRADVLILRCWPFVLAWHRRT
jgi:hypothetical protein